MSFVRPATQWPARAIAEQSFACDSSWPSLTAEGATTSGGHAIDSGRGWLERRLYDAPLPLVANNWPVLDDPSAPLTGTKTLP
jgi:hypothetical protein